MKVIRAIFSGLGITLMLALIFSLCLWFLGGYLGFGDARPFETVTGRVVGVGVIWIVALIAVLIVLLRHQKRDKELAQDIVASVEVAPDDGDEIVTAELGEMRDKLKAAMAKLRKSKLGKRSLYELPWYILIGPPGAGKTTAIVNSGLQFPLADELGKGAIGGVGGTRNCDWWFTDGAVLVDTAGRYTTQESDAVADNAAWLGFLGILKKHRKRQPINGAIVAISLSDLSMQDETTQTAHASAIRRRLHELRERLGVHFPVYVLFTKADLLAGFSEMFQNLGKEERSQVWGFTLPLLLKTGPANPMAKFGEEYQALISRLNDQSLERIQSETDPARRAMIAGFPAQVASVRPVAEHFLNELFQDNRFEHRQMLRGVYFTSGTQEGTPIDRLMMGMARTFGIGRQALGSGQGTGRSYFLTRLFDRVIFPESGLVSADDRVERRYRWTKRGAIAATVIFALAAGGLWARSFMGNRDLIAQAETQIEAFQALAAEIPRSPIEDADLPLVNPALNLLRDLALNPAGRADQAGLGWGLYQGKAIGNEAGLTYRAALNKMFLPRLLWRLEQQLQTNSNNPELLFEALRIYLMLGLSGPMNAELIKEWMAADWTLAYPGEPRAPLRDDLQAHLAAMLDQPMQKIELNGDLLTAVRAVLTDMPPAQRVYSSIVKSPAATDLAQFRLTDIGGPNLQRAMVRSSGTPLSEGIPGIYTYDGFNNVFLNEALSVAARIRADAWVLDPEDGAQTSDAALIALSRDVLDLYYTDFIGHYDRLLGDVDVIPMQSLSHAAEVTNILSGPTSPIVNILTAVAKETNLLAEPEGLEAVEGATTGAGAVLSSVGRRKLSASGRIFLEAMSASETAAGRPPPPEPGQYVTERFAWLDQLVNGQDGQTGQLEIAITALQAVSTELNTLNTQGDGPQGNSTALAQFQQALAGVREPLERWGQQIVVGSSGITAGNTRAGIDALWQAQVLPFCTAATANRYPFDPNARGEISLADFTRLFAAGGMLDTFFNENLAKHVDIRTRPWTFKKLNETDLGISEGVLKQFEHAAAIREAFFAGQGSPTFAFDMTPHALDPSAQAVVLEIDGQQLGFQQGTAQPRPVPITWPGPVGSARINFLPASTTSENTFVRDGEWAMFRMLDVAQKRGTSDPNVQMLIFRIGGRLAQFRLRAGSVLNPLQLPALTAFKCPASF